MKTKIISTLGLTLCMSVVSAQAFNYYGGVLLGAASTQISTDLSVYQTKGNPGQTFALLPQSTSNTGAIYGIFIGAQKKFERYFLGAELTLQTQTAPAAKDYTQMSSTYTNDLKESLGTTIGVAFVPGISLSPKWDVYGKFGYVMSQFSTVGNNPGNFGPKGNFTQSIGGINLGLGALYHLNHHWTTGLEYNYVNYSAFSLTGEDDQAMSGGAWGKVTANYKLSTSSVVLKASYWF